MAKISTVCVFCGSSFGQKPIYREEAARLGRMLAERKMALVYGGGGVGLMGVMAEAALAGGGEVFGVIPHFLQNAERRLDGLARLEVVDGMHPRKQRMFALADAFIVLPGGFGTLDETFEILTWRQLGLHDKPVVLVDIDGYWRNFRRTIEQTVADGFAQARTLSFLTFVPDVAAALAALDSAAAPAVQPAGPEKL